MYTMAEFRKNLRKAFNDANEGHEVVVERYDQKFQLVSLVSLPLGGSAFESTPKEIKPIKPLTPKLTPEAENIKSNKDGTISPKDPTKPAKFQVGGITPLMRKVSETPDMKFCKTHGVPLTSMGKCLQKGCKYA